MFRGSLAECGPALHQKGMAGLQSGLHMLVGQSGARGNAVVGRAGARMKLTPVTSFKGHNSGIFALAWDAQLKQLTSSSKDRKVILWDARGLQVAR